MVKGFSVRIIDLIIIFSLMLAVCVAVDYAATNITCDTCSNVTVNDSSKVLGINENDSNLIVSNKDKLYTDKTVKTVPTISMWAKPSVRSNYAYRWYKFTWIDYCPNCGHYNCLLKNPKMVPENEYTCAICDSDYCAVTGKEKYSWSHVYLRKA